MSSKIQKGFGFLHKPFGNVSTMCSNDAQPQSRVVIDQWTVPLCCCLSDVVDIVQIGLSLYADLFLSLINFEQIQPSKNKKKLMFETIFITQT